MTGLNGRVVRLEAAAREQHRPTRCRWHRPIVVYPTAAPRGVDDRVFLPPCEAPSTCSGAPRVQIHLPERRIL
jgi:hypothetical protein